MQIDPEEFRRHYDSLSDEALIEIDESELVDVARQCYEEELARRGIASKTEPAVASAESATHENWVLAATYLTAEEANMAHAMLESAAIPARLASNNTSAWSGTGELRLMVPPEFLEEAEIILASEISDDDLIAQAEAELPPHSAEED